MEDWPAAMVMVVWGLAIPALFWAGTHYRRGMRKLHNQRMFTLRSLKLEEKRHALEEAKFEVWRSQVAPDFQVKKPNHLRVVSFDDAAEELRRAATRQVSQEEVDDYNPRFDPESDPEAS